MSSEKDTSRPIEAEFREYVRGNLPGQDDEPTDTYWFAGLIPAYRYDVINHLAECEEAYEPVEGMPREFRNTQYAQEIIAKFGTHVATASLQLGNMGMLNYYSGLVGYKKDVSGMQILMNLQEMIRDIPVFVCYIYGLMGSGKTDFAMLLLEVFASVYGRENVYMAANITSEDLDSELKRWSRLVGILEDRRDRIQNGEDLDPIVVVVDEAAQIFSGSGADQHRAKQLAKLLKLARKSGANIILIGQDGKDIGPSLRALCTAFVHKESEKKATFYHDVKDRQGIGEMMSLSGIPPTNYDYSTWDEGDFIFDDEDEDESDYITQDELDDLVREHEREMMALLDVSTDLTQSEIGGLYDVSDKTVRRAKAEYKSQFEDIGLLE